MTSTSLPLDRTALRRALRAKAGEFLQRIYRREVLVARAVRGFQLEAVDLFEREVVRPVLHEVGGRLATFSPRGSDVSPDSHPELRALVAEAESIVQRGSEAMRTLTENRLRRLAQDEARFVAGVAQRETGTPVPAAQTPTRSDSWLGDNTERWFRKMLAGPTGDQIRQRVVQGVQQGQTTDAIVKSLKGTRSEVGVFDGSRRSLQLLVRTAATAASARSRLDSFKSLGVDRWRFVATLDSRTTLQCAAHDGREFPIGRGPIPPLHPNCRSTIVPVFGEPEGTRASKDGQVPADLTFPDWLKGRSITEQDEILGHARASAWRAGKLDFHDMLGRDLEPLTLAELRDLDRL